MAVFIPNVRPEDFNNSYGERQVYGALKTLNDQYTVFYSLSWVSEDDRRSIGEADFVILHPKKGVLVLEIKSGEIEYRNGVWYQTNTYTRYTKRIHPFSQARKSQFELLDRLRNADLDFPTPMVCYGVWFPSVVISDDQPLPPDAGKAIVLDQKSLLVPEQAIDNCFDYWAGKYKTVCLNQSQIQKVFEVLCPHFHVVPCLKTQIDEMGAVYIQLTNRQSVLLDYLEEQKTAVIHGPAGTGKTVLAVEKAKRLSSQKESVLFLCYNRFLKDMLRSSCAVPGVVFHNVHSLAYEIMGPSKTPIENVMREFEEFLEKNFDADFWNYRNIIIDEGQDLEDRLLNRLYDLARKKHGCFYVFYDRNQYIMNDQIPHWIENAECRLVLHKNCRNTAEVFKTSCSIMGLDHVMYNEIHGEVPSVQFYQTKEALSAIVNDFVLRVIKEGLTPDEVVILTVGSVEHSGLSTDEIYGGQTLSLSKESGKILFTTIRKFKGLEAEAVLIVDVRMSSLLREEDRRLLYVGTSRARNLLNLAMLEDVERGDLSGFIRDMAPGRNLPKNKKGLKRLLNIEIM